jgi:hypothetical protein
LIFKKRFFACVVSTARIGTRICQRLREVVSKSALPKQRRGDSAVLRNPCRERGEQIQSKRFDETNRRQRCWYLQSIQVTVLVARYTFFYKPRSPSSLNPSTGSFCGFGTSYTFCSFSLRSPSILKSHTPPYGYLAIIMNTPSTGTLPKNSRCRTLTSGSTFSAAHPASLLTHN